MNGSIDWAFAAGEWRRPLGRRVLAVRRSETGGWAWRVENTRMQMLDYGDEKNLDDAKAAAERRGHIVKMYPCHGSLAGGGSLHWELAEDDLPSADDLKASGVMSF